MLPDFLTRIIKGSGSSTSSTSSTSSDTSSSAPTASILSSTVQQTPQEHQNGKQKDVLVDVIDKISRPKLDDHQDHHRRQHHQPQKTEEPSSQLSTVVVCRDGGGSDRDFDNIGGASGAISEDLLALNQREVRATVAANFINKALLGFGSGLLMAFTIFRNSRKSFPIIFSTGWGMGVGYSQGSYLIRNCDRNK